MKRLAAALGLALAPLADPAASEVLIEARAWPAELGGQIDLENLENNEFFAGVDPINDLGLEEDGIFEGRLVFRPGRRTVLRFAWMPLSFTGDETIRGMVGDLVVTPRVQTALDLDYGRLAFAWQFLSARKGRLRLGPMIEVKGFQGEATVAVDNPIVPIVERTDFETGLASVGLMLDLEPSPRVSVFAEATSLVDTDEGDLRDAEIGLRFFATRLLAVTAGYRAIEIEIDDLRDRLEVDIDSFFAGVALRF